MEFPARPRRCASVRPLLVLMLGAFAFLAVSIAISHPGDQVRVARTGQGIIRDSTGKPIAGARIRRLSSQVSRKCLDPNVGSIENLHLVTGNADAPSAGRDGDADSGWSASTDAEGRFQVPPPETEMGRAIYLLTAEGFAPRLEATDHTHGTQVALDKGNDLVLHLLTDEEEAVGNAQATLIPLSFCEAAVQALPDLLIRSGRADPDGTVEIRNVPDGVYALRTVAKGRASSNLAPLVVGKGHSRFRLRLPPAASFSAAFEIPPQVTASPGTVIAIWNDPSGLLQWAEGRFTSGESSFELDGLPFHASFSLLVRTDNGLSSRWVSREEVAGSRTDPGKTIPLRPPGSWEGRLEDGKQTPTLLVEPVFPASAPPILRSEALTVQVGPAGRFVVPKVPPAAERLRMVAPGRGEADVRLEEGTGFNLGTVRIQPRRTFDGSVAWEDGLPLADVDIEVLSTGRTICRSRTTSTGGFACAFTGSDLRDVRFRALIPGAELRVAASSEKSSGPLTPSRGAVLRLLVTRSGGKAPVRDLQIDVGPNVDDAASGRNTGRRIRYGHSRDGTFILHTPEENRARFAVSVPGGGPKSEATVDIPSSGLPTETALSLPEGPAVFGRVLAGDTRNPVNTAEVEMRADVLYRDHADIARILRATEQGAWRFDEVPEGKVQLSAWAPGYSPAAKKSSVPAETSRTAQDLILPRPGRLQVKVVGLPEKSKASLSVWPRNWWIVRKNYRGDLDSSGQLVLENVRPDRYGLNLSVKGTSSMLGRRADTQVRPGETAKVEFDLRKGIALSGRATLGDKAIPGARITFSTYSEEMSRRETSSIAVDEHGKYSVVLPSAGRYILSLFDPSPENRGKMIDLGRPLEIGDESPQRRDLRFDDGRILGRVLDSDRKPIPGARIRISNTRSAADTGAGEKNAWESISSSTGTGSFEFGPLPPGDYVLDIMARGFAQHWTDSVPLVTDQVLELRDIVLERETAFRVQAVDPQGLPLPGMAVSAFLSLEFDRPSALGKTGESGEADMKGISPGTYTFIGLLRGWPPVVVEEVTVPPSTASPPTVLQVVRGGGLEIQVSDRSGSPVPDLRPYIMNAEGRDVTTIYGFLANLEMSPWQTDGEGRARLAAVVPGDYLIRVGSGSGSDIRRVTVSTGQTSRITLVIP